MKSIAVHPSKKVTYRSTEYPLRSGTRNFVFNGYKYTAN